MGRPASDQQNVVSPYARPASPQPGRESGPPPSGLPGRACSNLGTRAGIWGNICKFCILANRKITDEDKRLTRERTQSLEEVGGRGRAQHLPVEHVAQGLVPDPRVHRRACFPSDQIGGVMKKVDVDQVEGTVGTGQTVTDGWRYRVPGVAQLRGATGGQGPRVTVGSTARTPSCPTRPLQAHPEHVPCLDRGGHTRPQGQSLNTSGQLRRGCFLPKKKM